MNCTLAFNPLTEKTQQTTKWDPMSFRGLNLHKADFKAMNEELTAVDWDSLQTLCEDYGDISGEKFKELLTLTVLQVAMKHSPCKTQRKKAGPLESLKRRRRN